MAGQSSKQPSNPVYYIRNWLILGISEQPKPLFWFRSDTEAETEIGRYQNRYWNCKLSILVTHILGAREHRQEIFLKF